MTTYEDEKEYRTATDTQWQTRCEFEVEPGQVEGSFNLKTGKVRLLKNGRYDSRYKNGMDEFKTYTFEDEIQTSTLYEIQLAAYHDAECRIEDIVIQVEDPEE